MKEHATRRRSGAAARKSRPSPESAEKRSPGEETNTELLARLRRGDRAAWRSLLDRYERLIYAVPRRCGLSAEDAADVFQDVLHAFLKGLARIRDAEALPAWFLRTSFRYAMRRRKALQRDVRPTTEAFWDQLPDPRPDPAVALADLEAVAEVYEAVATIQGPCRRVLSALFLEDPGASYAEVAERLRMPIGSLGPTRQRCLDQLLGVLKEKRIREHVRATYREEPRRKRTPDRRKS